MVLGWTIQTYWAGARLVWIWYSVLGGLLLLVTPGRVSRIWIRFKDGMRVLPNHQSWPAKTVPVMFGAVLMTITAVALRWRVGTGGDTAC